MDRFLKRPTPAVDTSSVNSNPSKKPKPSAKQGDVSAAQEFGRNFYDSGGKMSSAGTSLCKFVSGSAA